MALQTIIIMYVDWVYPLFVVYNPEQFIESNTGHSWQEYLNNMSCEGIWTAAIIIQAVANRPHKFKIIHISC